MHPSATANTVKTTDFKFYIYICINLDLLMEGLRTLLALSVSGPTVSVFNPICALFFSDGDCLRTAW